MHRPGSSHSRAIARQPEAFALLSDRMAARTNPWAIGTATLVNGSIMALVILLGIRAASHPFPPTLHGDTVHITDFPFFAPRTASNGGNGSGSNDPVAPIEGRTPPYSATPLAPPMAPLIQQPKLPAESTIDIRLPDDNSIPNIGVHNSTNVTLASNGPGGPHGIGTGRDGEIGPGSGNRGWGPGSGDQIYSPNQRGVIAPQPILTPEAEFSDEARRQKYQGICVVALIVDAHGNPQNVHVIRALGMGLDEQALKAVRGYRFKPGTKDGKPVPVMISVAVDFHLY